MHSACDASFILRPCDSLATADGQNAVRSLQRAVEINPKHAGAQLKIAEIMTVIRDEKLLKEAASRLQDAFGSSPNGGNGYLGASQMAIG